MVGSELQEISLPEHLPSQSLYPDPEQSQTLNSAWAGQGQRHVDPARVNSNDSGIYAPDDLSFLSQHAGDWNDEDLSQEDFISHARPTCATLDHLTGTNSADSDLLHEMIGLEDVEDADPDYRHFYTEMKGFGKGVNMIKSSGHSEHDKSIEMADVLQGLELPGSGHRVRQRIGQSTSATGRKGAPKGPRKAAEPTGDIKMRISNASNAFIAQDYPRAKAIISEVIRINAETYEAWTMLATIFTETGETSRALTALMIAAHMRPKSPSGWFSCAYAALAAVERDFGQERTKYLASAQFCFAAVLRTDPRNQEARLGKAGVYIQRGSLAGAISELKTVLVYSPHDTSILRKLAEVYVDYGEVPAAIDIYKKLIDYCRSSRYDDSSSFTWTDADIYIELNASLGEYETAIRELKAVARWLLGREDQTFWDDVVEDDREWDADHSRRLQLPGFISSQHPLLFYGQGLPMELRVKLGLYRLNLGQHEEALRHFNWLDSPENSAGNFARDSAHLLELVADQLKEAGLHRRALNFYQTLVTIAEQNTAHVHVQIGMCYLLDELIPKAEEYFKSALDMEEHNIDARIQLALIYEKKDNPQQAFNYVNEVMTLRNGHHPRVSGKRVQHERPAPGEQSSEREQGAAPRRESRQPRERISRQQEEIIKAENLKRQFEILKTQRDGMRNEDPLAVLSWMDAARELTDDFRSFKTFYPWDKYVRFLGYSGDARVQAETRLDLDLTAMASRLSRNLGADVSHDSRAHNSAIPADYRGISFSTWLDIFLEFALCLARKDKIQESYELCEAARDSIVYCHSREDMFLIHICWCMCALFANDEEKCVTTARFFMTDFQFTTDSYRLFGAVTRICHSPISWYSSGPTQKYILRQIKAMDYALVDKTRREKHFTEKASYSTHDGNGHAIINNDLDVALLMVYGHILSIGTSYVYALNYFFRAYALDPTNPMISLNIGLAYIHHALKRQSENRQHGIVQGLAFLFRYYESRKLASCVAERQEAHFNIARVYHMLGLTHLAVPYYQKVLDEEIGQSSIIGRDSIIVDAVYNLQTLYSIAGNSGLSEIVTNTWLVT